MRPYLKVKPEKERTCLINSISGVLAHNSNPINMRDQTRKIDNLRLLWGTVNLSVSKEKISRKEDFQFQPVFYVLCTSTSDTTHTPEGNSTKTNST